MERQTNDTTINLQSWYLTVLEMIKVLITFLSMLQLSTLVFRSDGILVMTF